jgi:2-keto-myo-inositol isomerase
VNVNQGENDSVIPCINQATILTTDTAKFLQVAKKHGFTHVELDISKVEEFTNKNGPAALTKILRGNKITVVSLNAIENCPILSEAEMSKSLRRSEQLIELSRSLDCGILVVNPNETAERERAITRSRFGDFLLATAKIAESHDVRLGFEYVSYDNRIINSLAQSLDCLHDWGSRTVGLVLDVFHMYRSREMINAIPQKDRILLWAFHVNDAPNIPISKLQDSDRVMPLEGVINLHEYIRELQAIDFDGPVSVELFNKQYWQMDPDIVMAKASNSLKELGVRV